MHPHSSVIGGVLAFSSCFSPSSPRLNTCRCKFINVGFLGIASDKLIFWKSSILSPPFHFIRFSFQPLHLIPFRLRSLTSPIKITNSLNKWLCPPAIIPHLPRQHSAPCLPV